MKQDSNQSLQLDISNTVYGDAIPPPCLGIETSTPIAELGMRCLAGGDEMTAQRA